MESSSPRALDSREDRTVAAESEVIVVSEKSVTPAALCICTEYRARPLLLLTGVNVIRAHER